MHWEELTLPFDDLDAGAVATEPVEPTAAAAVVTAVVGEPSCDLSTQCGHCGGPMRPEHAHYRCTQCGQRDSCCDGPY